MKHCEHCGRADCVLIDASYTFTDDCGTHWAEKTYECFSCGRAHVITAPISRLPAGLTERRAKKPKSRKLRRPTLPLPISNDPLRALIHSRIRVTESALHQLEDQELT